MSAERIVIAHLSDLHFGGHADLAQIEALEAFLPTLGPDAIVIAWPQMAVHVERHRRGAVTERRLNRGATTARAQQAEPRGTARFPHQDAH